MKNSKDDDMNKEEAVTFAIVLPKGLFDKVSKYKNKNQFIKQVLEEHFKCKKECEKDLGNTKYEKYLQKLRR